MTKDKIENLKDFHSFPRDIYLPPFTTIGLGGVMRVTNPESDVEGYIPIQRRQLLTHN